MQMAETQPPQDKLDGAGAFHLNSHPAAGGAVNAGLPYKLYKDAALTEQGVFDDSGNMTFKHDLDKQSKYELELPNGNRYAIAPNSHEEQHEISTGIGYHGYTNSAGAVNEDRATLEQSRVLSNPALRDEDEPSKA